MSGSHECYYLQYLKANVGAEYSQAALFHLNLTAIANLMPIIQDTCYLNTFSNELCFCSHWRFSPLAHVDHACALLHRESSS